MSKTFHDFGSINVNSLTTLNKVSVAKATVSQATAITSGVTLNSPAGFITAVTSTLATLGNAKFTVTNNCVNSSSIVLANIVNYSGNSGIPVISVNNINNGTFVVSLNNAASTGALNGIVKVGFCIV